ncbi:MAG: FeoC-like transcriptional regulator [Cyanobacteria bacterium P01_H01_bin.105]
MILSELQNYIADQHKVSLAQIEVKFGIEATALRGMLSQLIRKRRVQKLPSPQRCHGCDICSQESLEFYESISLTPSHREQAETSPCGGACYIESGPTSDIDSLTAGPDCNFGL